MRPRFHPRPWSQQLATESAWTIGIVGVLLAICLQYASVILVKARLTDVLYSVMSLRIDLMETGAVSGDLAMGLRPGGAGGPSRESIEDALSMRPSRATAAQAAANLQEAGLQDVGKPVAVKVDAQRLAGDFAYQIKDHRVVVSGQISGMSERFRLSFTPAVIANGAPTNVIWLCGDHPPPKNWLALRDPQGMVLPAPMAYSFCRADKVSPT